MQPVQPKLELLLVCAIDRMDREFDKRIGKGDLREAYRMGASGQRVIRVGIPELGHAADVASMKARHLDAVAALRHRQVIQLLRDVARDVVQLVAIADGTRQHAKEAHVAHVRLALCLEHDGRERSVVICMNLDRTVALGPSECVDLFHFPRVGHQLDDCRQHGPRAVVERGRCAEERKQLAAFHRILHGGDGLVARYLFTVQVALEERVVRGGNRLDQLRIVAVELRLHLCRHVGLFVRPASRAPCIDVRLPVEEVHDTVEVRTLADRHLDWNDFRGEPLADLLVDRIEIGVLLVHHRDDEHHRIPPRHRLPEHALRSHFDAGRRSNHAERAIRRRKTRKGVALEVQEARRVEQVDLAPHPLGVCTAEIDRVAALQFLGRRVGQGGAINDTAMPLTRAGHEGQRIDQAGLAAASVSNHRDVADFGSLILSHS